MEENLIKHEKLESLGILAGGIAHDFNNILTAVMANISLAVLDNNSNHLVHASLAEAQKAISRAHDLTNQLLTFSRGGAPVKSLIPIAKIIKEASSFALSGSKVRCRFSIPDDLFNVRADSGQMSQVFHNLILNAGQAMPDGGDIIISAENYIIKRKDPIPLKAGNFVKIIIKDHGCGIAEKYLNKIFDPFFTTKQKGSGLGLSSTYSIIKKHGGHIEVESRFGHGTAFTIYLSASKKRMGLTNLKEEGLLPGSGQILLMDDDEAIQKATGKVLEKVGYEVDYASNGRETIKKYSGALKKGHPYDAVILDLTIPGGIGGVEVANRLREMDPHIRAIVTSGYSNNPILSNYTKYGFMGYIPKPYEIKKMITTVRKVIDNEVC